MGDEPNIATPAALIGDPTRAAIMLALFDGRAQPAGALAHAVSISAQAASNHLAKLVAGELLLVETEGRRRYYRLANERVAHALEALTALAAPIRSLERPRSPKARELRFARCCYDHLAGRVGVAIADTLEGRGLLVDPASGDRRTKLYEISASGHCWFGELGIDVDRIRPAKRGLARRCLDWTERRHHLAGPLGRALFTRFGELEWVVRDESSRVVRVTHKGARELKLRLAIDVCLLRAEDGRDS